MKRMILAGFLICLLLTSLISCKQKQYNEALDLIEQGQIEAAYAMLGEMGDYRKAQELLTHFYKVPVRVIKDQGHNVVTVEYAYGEDSLLRQIAYKHSDGYNATEDYTFDSDGNLTQYLHTDQEGTRIIRDYAYDANGNMLRKTVTSPDGSKGITACTYDASNRLTRETFWHEQGEQSAIDYIYDGNGYLLRKIYSDAPSEESYAYDGDGNLIKRVHTHYDGGKDVYEYTYDGDGNMLREMKWLPLPLNRLAMILWDIIQLHHLRRLRKIWIL